MSDNVLLEIARQIPSAVLLFAVFLVVLKHLKDIDQTRMEHDKEMESIRIAAAKEREADKRAFDQQTNAMWANSIKSIMDQQDKLMQMVSEKLRETVVSFANGLAEHEENSKDRYKALGITQNLLEAAKESMKMQQGQKR